MTVAERFARLSGARLAPKSAPSPDERVEKEAQPENHEGELSIELPSVVPAAEAVPVTEERTYVEDKFNTKKPIWQNPKVKMAVISVPSLAATFGILAAMNGSFTIPGTSKIAAKPEADDTAPKTASVGDVQGVALSRGLSTGFDKEGDRKNPFLENGVPSAPTTKATGKLQPKGNTVNTGAAAHTYPVTRLASANVATDNIPSRTYNRPYTPPLRTYAPAYTSLPSRATYPTRSTASQPATPSVASTPEKTADERRLAVLAMTSSGTDNTQQSATAATTAAEPGQAQTVAGKPSGYQEATYLSSEESVIDGIPQQAINRSKKAQGRLMVGVAFTSGAAQFMQGQPVEIAIENPMDTGLPKGAHLIATVDLQSQGNSQTTSAPVRLVPTAIAIGDAEYPLPQGTILLTGENGKPLVAKRQGSAFLRFMGTMAKSAAGGIGGVATTLMGASPIMTALSPQLQAGSFGNQGAQQTGNEVLALRENTPIQINIIRPLSLPVSQAEPTGGDQALVPPADSTEKVSEQVPTAQKTLVPVTTPPDTTAYREPTDSELTGLVQQQQQPVQQPDQSQGQPSEQQQSVQQQGQQPDQQPVQPQVQQPDQLQGQQPMEGSQYGAQ